MSSDPVINAALFRFCQMADDGPRESDAAQRPPRDLEDLKWLREALASVEAPERIVQKLLLVIGNDNSSDDEVVEALEELSDTVEDLNWAIEFVLMGGHTIVLRLMEASPRVKANNIIRRNLAMVIAHASQQNDKVQEAFNNAKWADVIVPLTRSEEDPATLAALLHACSCMCRECDVGSAAFIAAGGMEVLQKLLSPELAEKINEKIVLRVLFLVGYFSQVGVSSEALIEHTCAYVASPSSSEEVSTSATKVVAQLVKKSPSVLSKVRKMLLPYLEGLQGLANDSQKKLLRDALSGAATAA